MPFRSIKPFGRALAVAAFVLASAPAFAQTGPFAVLAGTWSGEGTITTSSGASERIRCRARYTVGEGGRAFQQALTCASDSYKFEISSNVETDGTRVTGTWSEATRGVSGSLSGRISGPNISAMVEAQGFQAGIAVNTRGRSQSVNIKPGGTDVTDVTVNLHK
ncbi:MAG TPA: hypothetical protein VGX95_06130 [Xanthobacteraceae bacterium]|jgi:hypothetical protein|nr:hypothetical protein [Xanthobacteraceae bacterium]